MNQIKCYILSVRIINENYYDKKGYFHDKSLALLYLTFSISHLQHYFSFQKMFLSKTIVSCRDQFCFYLLISSFNTIFILLNVSQKKDKLLNKESKLFFFFFFKDSTHKKRINLHTNYPKYTNLYIFSTMCLSPASPITLFLQNCYMKSVLRYTITI